MTELLFWGRSFGLWIYMGSEVKECKFFMDAEKNCVLRSFHKVVISG